MEVVALVSSLTSDLAPQMAEPFPNKRESTFKDCYEPWSGLTVFPSMKNCSAICSSRSEVRDETSATISMKDGAYFSNFLFTKISLPGCAYSGLESTKKWQIKLASTKTAVKMLVTTVNNLFHNIFRSFIDKCGHNCQQKMSQYSKNI